MEDTGSEWAAASGSASIIAESEPSGITEGPSHIESFSATTVSLSTSNGISSIGEPESETKVTTHRSIQVSRMVAIDDHSRSGGIFTHFCFASYDSWNVLESPPSLCETDLTSLNR